MLAMNGKWSELEPHEVPVLKSAADLAKEKGRADALAGKDQRDQYTTLEMRIEYAKGWWEARGDLSVQATKRTGDWALW
jgi:ribosome modulation factor